MSNSNQDKVFHEKKSKINDFVFNGEVASVFDDMLNRSVPFYGEMQRMIQEMSVDFIVPETNVYDLGCSLGTTMILLNENAPQNVKFIGVDNSEEMLVRCRENLIKNSFSRPFDLIMADLNKGVVIENASVVSMLLTLQFIRPLYRETIMKTIYNGLNDNGCLFLIEKVLGEDSMFNRLFIKYYYDMKRRQGYSDMEISQKREALENVLIPYKLRENRELLVSCGFSYVEYFFKWYNFCGIVAVK
ncbi:MAG: carboxy-S-adenosyl-L-methionine synthase CmoA [Planctomycetota bacterium]